MASKPIHSFESFQEYVKTVKISPKYDSAAEGKLGHAWWDVDKPAIHALLKDISEQVATCVRGVPGLDKELQHVANTAAKLEQVERGAVVKVALIGAQGAGKSLLINALFDCTGLSLTGAKGFACTSTIVKYAYGPSKKFSAEVRFLNAEMRDRMINEHIRSYVDYYNDLEDSDDEGSRRRTRSFKQDEVDRKRKQTAEDFFSTLFGSKEEFVDAWSSSPVDTEEFKSLCQIKCKDAMEGFDSTSQGVTHFIKSSPTELVEEIRPFLSNVDGKVCLWPIVDCVTVRLNSALLKEGLEIIDLPGSGDVNMSRTRHADAVKDSVDVEIILGDTVRIGTDDMIMSTARAGILNHGPSNVKVLATKIDVISDDQLAQCTGGIYNEIKKLTTKADEEAALADEEDNDAKVAQVNRYKRYLHHCSKAQMIQDRASEISEKLGATLKSLSRDGAVEIFHTSTAEYMNWIKTEKIGFNHRPALSPEETGVPPLRRFLFNLPAPQNIRDYTNHINVAVPTFVDKLKHVIGQSDRDAGFLTIADEFDYIHRGFISTLVRAINSTYRGYVEISMRKITKDNSQYKAAIKNLIENRWLTLQHFAFTRLLKARGKVPKGVSKARGLENSVNWNMDIASILRPGFENWYCTHSAKFKLLAAALPREIDRLYHEIISMMSRSSANLITVEKSKLKWVRYRNPMQSKLKAMLKEMADEEQRFLNRATLKDERENNMIAALTDSIYDEVFISTPALKTNSAPNSKKKYYVSSLIQFRKEGLARRFLNDKAHFVDRLTDLFREQLQDKMLGLVDKHFTKLTAYLNEFSIALRGCAPLDFSIDYLGEKIREELEKRISDIETKSEELKTLLPLAAQNDEDESADAEYAGKGNPEQGMNLEFYLKQAQSQKRKGCDQDTATKEKKFKYESD
ncbi:hypothetical protein GQ44DRAFT_760353 [Phaeosphaeriaceae sp. PMI808]|nr:hypothetical protein GQ44DRAFT_760353 [Phaeosphaeriaceae sp. PMI808]